MYGLLTEETEDTFPTLAEMQHCEEEGDEEGEEEDGGDVEVEEVGGLASLSARSREEACTPWGNIFLRVFARLVSFFPVGSTCAA